MASSRPRSGGIGRGHEDQQEEEEDSDSESSTSTIVPSDQEDEDAEVLEINRKTHILFRSSFLILNSLTDSLGLR